MTYEKNFGKKLMKKLKKKRKKAYATGNQASQEVIGGEGG